MPQYADELPHVVWLPGAGSMQLAEWGGRVQLWEEETVPLQAANEGIVFFSPKMAFVHFSASGNLAQKLFLLVS